MSNFSYAEAEVMARRYLRSFDKTADDRVEFEVALEKVWDAIEVIEHCGGHIAFLPPLRPAGGVYGEELRQNWLTGWVQ